MKKIISLFCFSILVLSSLSSFSQTSKVVSDTGKLKKEYVQLTNEITFLTSQLTAAKNSLPAYQLQVNASDRNTSNTSVVEARAKKAYEDNAKAALHNLNNQHDKITILASEISKKQQRLQELTAVQTIL